MQRIISHDQLGLLLKNRAQLPKGKQWQDGYNKVLEVNKALPTENNELKGKLKQLDRCGYMEHEIDSLNDTIGRGWGTDETNKRRDSFQEQLSSCRQ